MRRVELQRRLAAVPGFEVPDAALEQYVTPPAIAAALVHEAHDDGCIGGRDVIDLGCGTGVLSLAATLLGGRVVGVDVSRAALTVARAAAPMARFVHADVATWVPESADTVIMNPPFGAQRRHADRVFYDKALATGASTVWFLAQAVGEPFLQAMAKAAGRDLEKVGQWDYPLSATMAHHTDAVRTIAVGGYRLG